MKKIRYYVFIALSVGALVGTLAPLSVAAQTGSSDAATLAAANAPCKEYLFGSTVKTFPAWYRGLVDANCDIKSPATVGLSKFAWKIVLNVVEMILNVAGYLSVAFIIYGGYKYMISAGSADGMVGARKTILNAVIGLAISIAAVAIVRTITNAMGQV